MKNGLMAQVDMPKEQPSPVGRELSIDVGKFKGFKAYKVGDKVKFECEGVVVGQHMHNVGKSKEHMYDVKLTSIECDNDTEEQEAE